MKLKVIGALFLVGLISDSSAQSLDIGGVELRLGQDINEALKSLSFYRAVYTGKNWLVLDENRTGDKILGSFGAKNNKLIYVSRGYNVSDTDVSALYSNVNSELTQRGGLACSIYEVKLKVPLVNDHMRGFEKKCGAYKLSYMFQSIMTDGQLILPSLSLYVGETGSVRQ